MPTAKVEVNKKTYSFLKNTKKRVNLLYGSAGSGKSWSLAQFFLLEKFYKEHDIRMLMIRKTRPALKKSIWLLMHDLISQYNLPVTSENKSDLTLTWKNNQMFFVPLDDPEKLKSFERINYVWAEEATELTKEDYMQLALRCRGKNPNGHNALFYSFNPIDEHSFFKGMVDNPPENMGVNHSLFQDNAFLEPEYIQELENLKDQDETYYKIYALGQWASPESLIYSNYEIVDEFPDGCDVGYGLDFGFNNQTALIKIGVKDQEVYVHEDLYESKLTNADLIERMNTIIPNKSSVIMADSAEPQRIEEILRAGYNVKPSVKGKDSVRSGIDRVKATRLHITKESVNVIAEIHGYKWKVDKNGIILDEPVQFRDHALDGIRYYVAELPVMVVIEVADIAVGQQVRDFEPEDDRMEQDW